MKAATIIKLPTPYCSGMMRPGRLALLLALLLAPLCHADDLLQIYNLAQQQDTQLAEARARFEADHTLLDQGRSRLLPTVRLTGQSARNAQAPESIFKYHKPYNTHSYGLSIQQSLLNMESWYGWQSAKSGDDRAQATLAREEQDVIVRVARAYFDVLRSKEALSAFEAEETAAKAVLDQMQQRMDVGLAAITDVNEAQASYDLSRVNRLKEERNLNQRRLSLEVITGRTHDTLKALDAEFPIVSVEPDSAEEWVALATQNSPAIRIADSDYRAKINDAKAAGAGQLPTLALNANYNRNAESVNPYTFLSGTASIYTNFQLTLTIPLYSGGYNNARKRQAYHLRDASEQILVRAKRESERNTRDSYSGVETDVLAVAARQQAIVSARSALQAVEAGAQVGTRNTIDVVTAQRNLYSALRDYASARYDYVIDTLTLKQAAGVLTPEDVISLNEWLK